MTLEHQARRASTAVAGISRPGRRIRSDRHRHRHSAREVQRDLRGLSTSRHGNVAQVRRHRPRASRSAARSRRCSAARSPFAASIGEGSTFTFYHPLERNVWHDRRRAHRCDQRSASRAHRPPGSPRRRRSARASARSQTTGKASTPTDRVLLIVEDDLVFARILLGLARDRGFKGIVALSATQGLALARQFRPDAITLDIGLPDADGWSLLHELKGDAATADIPVHVISGEEQWQRALDFGAVTHLRKPVTEETLTETFDSLLGFDGDRSKNLLLVEDDLTQLNAMINFDRKRRGRLDGGAQRRRSDGCDRAAALRLHRRRPRPPRYAWRRADRADAANARGRGGTDYCLYCPRPDAPRRGEARPAQRDGDRQGRARARAFARRSAGFSSTK